MRLALNRASGLMASTDVLGVVAGNVLDLHSQEWFDFTAAFASIVLTFLAGVEVDP